MKKGSEEAVAASKQTVTRHATDNGTELDQSEGQASSLPGFVTLLKKTIGGGIISAPLAFSELGVGAGVLLLCFATVLSCYGNYFLVACGAELREEGHRVSWSSIARKNFPWMGPLINLAIVLNEGGTATSYLILAGLTMESLAHDVFGISEGSFWATRVAWQSILFVGILTPLSFLRNITSLKYAAVIGNLSAVYLAVLAVVYVVSPPMGNEEASPDSVVVWKAVSVKDLGAVSVLIFALYNQSPVPQIYRESKETRVKHFAAKVTTAASLCSGVVTIVVALFAYLYLGKNTRADFILSYPVGDPAVVTARFAIVLIALAAFPIDIHPTRDSVLCLWRDARALFQRKPVEGDEESAPATTVEHILITSCLLGVSFVVAWFVSDLGFIFGIIGAVACTALMLHIPGILFWWQYRGKTRRTSDLSYVSGGFANTADGAEGRNSEAAVVEAMENGETPSPINDSVQAVEVIDDSSSQSGEEKEIKRQEGKIRMSEETGEKEGRKSHLSLPGGLSRAWLPFQRTMALCISVVGFSIMVISLVGISM
uniref:Amino acid transporter transmembrane domain-containing protein n=1 Tax=Chromera velia CCMP2878 TaxID=1169474 RepID=A0A0G4I6J7_9ALVE|eukprot:Cvel_11387.t1-p1 / transcript=Cvel_11387.t1 / gene=Cvel_11387 / organism=Chromera_velia_CCMP2878 / gene_product=Vacuolar amino acid transporter 5, putative / transcript_product=Vacuolar amino acid transporter 5, putative / location=Cvel_scaffold714:17509-19474(+) / protein_length=542 / sequence_SO=supercontig / SO=protein_coding / is_pseudo=false